MSISISSNNTAELVRKHLLGFEKQLPYAMMRAINMTADDIKAAEVNAMKAVFHRPKPWTLNSVRIDRAKKTTLSATIKIDDREIAGGTSAGKYLMPQAFGGNRRIKRFEKALSHAGLLPSGLQAVPGKGIKLDQYGNITRSMYSKILSDLDARNAKKSNKAYFVANGKGRLEAGVWLRIGREHIRPIIMFVGQNQYQQRFDFFGVGMKVAQSVFDRHFAQAAQQAINTAK